MEKEALLEKNDILTCAVLSYAGKGRSYMMPGLYRKGFCTLLVQLETWLRCRLPKSGGWGGRPYIVGLLQGGPLVSPTKVLPGISAAAVLESTVYSRGKSF